VFIMSQVSLQFRYFQKTYLMHEKKCIDTDINPWLFIMECLRSYTSTYNKISFFDISLMKVHSILVYLRSSTLINQFVDALMGGNLFSLNYFCILQACLLICNVHDFTSKNRCVLSTCITLFMRKE